MLGPLPPLYRWLVGAVTLLACVFVGAWLAATLPVPLLAPAGAGIGAALGVVAVVALLHSQASGRPVRARQRHR